MLLVHYIYDQFILRYSADLTFRIKTNPKQIVWDMTGHPDYAWIHHRKRFERLTLTTISQKFKRNVDPPDRKPL